MKNILKNSALYKDQQKANVLLSYSEIINFLNDNWHTEKTQEETLACMQKLNHAFGNIAQKMKSIFITGTNGKSLTTHFIQKLLQKEGVTVGCLHNPHILTYNERLSSSAESSIPNKTFTEIANEVLNASHTIDIKINSKELITMMGLLYFNRSKCDLIVIEIDSNTQQPAYICSPIIAGLTRLTNNSNEDAETIKNQIHTMLSFTQKDMYIVSADQNKLHLQIAQELASEKKCIWGMPIRKLAGLNYPYNQLHGRSAAFAERISSLYLNNFIHEEVRNTNSNSLLAQPKGKRGRPTLSAKRKLELNPKKTIDQFWKETQSTLPGRFQYFENQNPSLLLDNANNIDAFENLFLGIRLLHYKRALKGTALILSCDNTTLDKTELVHALRYFFKKVSGTIFLCPLKNKGFLDTPHWDIQKIASDLKSMKINARICNTFEGAFIDAQKVIDDRDGLMVISGSHEIIAEYWTYKGYKKL